MILEKFLPVRSPADILGGVIRVRFGADEHVVPVLTIDENDVWLVKAQTAFALLFAGFTKLDDPKAILARLLTATQTQIDLLGMYDLTGVLPDSKTIRSVASQDQLVNASLEVLAAAYPPAAIVLDLAVQNPTALRSFTAQMIGTMVTSSESMNGSRRPTAGARQKTSGGGSRTSSSSPTSIAARPA